QTVHAGLAGDELRVVVIVHVDGHSVGKSGKAGRKPHRGSQHRRAAAWGKTKGFQILLNQSPGFGLGTAECESKTIQNRLLSKFERFRGDVSKLEVHDKLGRIPRQIWNLRKAPFSRRLRRRRRGLASGKSRLGSSEES